MKYEQYGLLDYWLTMACVALVAGVSIMLTLKG